MNSRRSAGSGGWSKQPQREGACGESVSGEIGEVSWEMGGGRIGNLENAYGVVRLGGVETDLKRLCQEFRMLSGRGARATQVLAEFFCEITETTVLLQLTVILSTQKPSREQKGATVAPDGPGPRTSGHIGEAKQKGEARYKEAAEEGHAAALGRQPGSGGWNGRSTGAAHCLAPRL